MSLSLSSERCRANRNHHPGLNIKSTYVVRVAANSGAAAAPPAGPPSEPAELYGSVQRRQRDRQAGRLWDRNNNSDSLSLLLYFYKQLFPSVELNHFLQGFHNKSIPGNSGTALLSGVGRLLL